MRWNVTLLKRHDIWMICNDDENILLWSVIESMAKAHSIGHPSPQCRSDKKRQRHSWSIQKDYFWLGDTFLDIISIQKADQTKHFHDPITGHQNIRSGRKWARSFPSSAQLVGLPSQCTTSASATRATFTSAMWGCECEAIKCQQELRSASKLYCQIHKQGLVSPSIKGV